MPDVNARQSHRLHRFAAPAAIAMALVLFALSIAVDASRPIRIVADPTPVAVVNVSRIFDEIDERSEWDIRIETIRSSIQTEAAGRKAAMERRLAESESAPGADDRQRIRDEVALMQLRFEQWASVKSGEIDREESLKWRSIYRSMKQEAARVAEAEGFAIVMVDDSIGDIQTTSGNQTPLQQQVVEQIMDRRVLFARETIDISDQVIVRMNNAANAAP